MDQTPDKDPVKPDQVTRGGPEQTWQQYRHDASIAHSGVH